MLKIVKSLKKGGLESGHSVPTSPQSARWATGAHLLLPPPEKILYSKKHQPRSGLDFRTLKAAHEFIHAPSLAALQICWRIGVSNFKLE